MKATLVLYNFILILIPGVWLQKCLDDNNQFFCKLSVKTPYRFIANYNDSHPNYPGCMEKKIWMLVRHGTRFPGGKDIKLMLKKLPELQDKIFDSFEAHNSKLPVNLIQKISDWKITFDNSHTSILAPEGENELIDLAERMQSRFPQLFPETYDNNTFKFKYTATQRAENSAKFFTLGLFGQNQTADIYFLKPESQDPILRFYKRCEQWKASVKKNPEAYKERDLFIQTKIVQDVLLDISNRIGFPVDFDSARIMYLMCAYETAWNETTNSSWCEIFTLNDMKVLDFVRDLDHYWIDGYGYQLNYKQACPVFRDVFTFFESNNKTLVTAYFSHSGAILKVLSLLGIGKDEMRLTHESFQLLSDSRKWKLSLIDAFASNIAFVLYDCKEQGPSILLMHQERAINIPGCPSGDLCPISKMKELFPDTEEECQFDILCIKKQETI